MFALHPNNIRGAFSHRYFSISILSVHMKCCLVKAPKAIIVPFWSRNVIQRILPQILPLTHFCQKWIWIISDSCFSILSNFGSNYCYVLLHKMTYHHYVLQSFLSPSNVWSNAGYCIEVTELKNLSRSQRKRVQ